VIDKPSKIGGQEWRSRVSDAGAAQAIARRLIDEFGATDALDTADADLRAFIFAAARLVLKSEDVACQVWRERA
jgi:hypothetical protein